MAAGQAWQFRTHGSSPIRSVAKARALGEAMERYCFYDNPLKNIFFGDWKSLGDRAVHPSELARYSETQLKSAGFPYARFDETTKIRWVEGVSLVSGRGRWVPAQYVLPETRDETRIFGANTVGGACGASREAAELGALCEVIEREAFMIMWLNKLSMPLVSLSRLPPTLDAFYARLKRPHLDCKIINLTTDIGIPVFLAVLRQKKGIGPALALGIGCKLEPEQAFEKALSEASLLWSDLVRVYQNCRELIEGLYLAEVFRLVRQPGTHAHIYANARISKLADFIDASPVVKRFDSIGGHSTGTPKTNLAKCVALLKRAGLDAIVVDITKDEIKRLGYRVVKAIIPGLQPMHWGNERELLNNDRLYELPVKLGHLAKPKTEEQLYKIPHPLE